LKLKTKSEKTRKKGNLAGMPIREGKMATLSWSSGARPVKIILAISAKLVI
jgi:hypothetical protein